MLFVRRFQRRLCFSIFISVLFVMCGQQALFDFIKTSFNFFTNIRTTADTASETRIDRRLSDLLRQQYYAADGRQIPRPPTSSEENWEILGNPTSSKMKLTKEVEVKSERYSGESKLILSFNEDIDQSNLDGCPEYNCRITNDVNLLKETDAVIVGDMELIDDPTILLNERSPNQYYVHFSQESPMHWEAMEPFSGFYNITMGYRRDSDVPCPYGYTIKLNERQPVKSLGAEQLRSKNRPIAWFVSNCGTPSQRMGFVNELKNYIRVDVYGDCGELICSKEEQDDCNELLSREYRFYLAFENSICKDYITEKLWNQGYHSDVVPIVLKRSLVEPYVPPNSFLAADDFESPAKLAEHILSLMQDDVRYETLLMSWRQTHDVIFLDGVVHDWKERPWGFCRLCDLLWERPRPQKIQHDMQKWWNGSTICDNELVNRLLLSGA